MPEPRPEFHYYEDLSLTPAYVMGYAFHALGRIDAKTSIHGREGALTLLNELFATLTSLKFATSLLAAEPLRFQQQKMARSPRSARVGAVSAAEVVSALAIVEVRVREELRGRAPVPPSSSAQIRFGGAALGQCPDALRYDATQACRALEAGLYTAAVFHLYRVWEGLAAPGALTRGFEELPVADPRVNFTLRCNKAEATSVLEAIRRMLESLRGPPRSE